MTTDHPVGERELDADGWPVGMTREQILAAAGMARRDSGEDWEEPAGEGAEACGGV